MSKKACLKAAKKPWDSGVEFLSPPVAPGGRGRAYARRRLAKAPARGFLDFRDQKVVAKVMFCLELSAFSEVCWRSCFEQGPG